MTIFLTLAGLFVAVVVLAVLIRWLRLPSGAPWYHLFRTTLADAGDYARRIQPAKQMRQAVRDDQQSVFETDRKLIDARVVEKGLERQKADWETQARRLEADLRHKLAAGVPETDPGLLLQAQQLQRLKTSIQNAATSVEKQRALREQVALQNNVKAAELQSTEQEADLLEAELNLKQQGAKLTSSLTAPTLGNSKVDEYRKVVQQEIDRADAEIEHATSRGSVLGTTPVVSPDVSDLLASLRPAAPSPTPRPS